MVDDGSDVREDSEGSEYDPYENRRGVKKTIGPAKQRPPNLFGQSDSSTSSGMRLNIPESLPGDVIEKELASLRWRCAQNDKRYNTVLSKIEALTDVVQDLATRVPSTGSSAGRSRNKRRPEGEEDIKDDAANAGSSSEVCSSKAGMFRVSHLFGSVCLSIWVSHTPN